MSASNLPDPTPCEREQMEEAELLGPGLIHEMRHPLLGIKAGLELIARRIGQRLTDLDDWQMVTTQVARLEELFRSYQQLLAPGPIPASRFAVDAVVQRAVELLAWRVRRLGSRFEWTREAAQARGSPNAMLHAAVNLLANAIDAVEEAGGARRVAVRVLREPLEVRVSDEGAGISQEHRGLLFQPRFTTKAQGRGTGLGLHIARTAMQRSGGDVRLVGPTDPRRLAWAVTEFSIHAGEG
jgi:two-component system nitrogen regulation sensor histidine kinase GlnL